MRTFAAALFGAVALASTSTVQPLDICEFNPDLCDDNGVPLSTDPCQVDPNCPKPDDAEQIQDANEKTVCIDGQDTLCDDGECWCVDSVDMKIEFTSHGPLLTSNHTSNKTWVGERRHYLVGHWMLWADGVLHILIAFLVGQLWWKTKFKDDSLNLWYGYAWKAMQAGSMISYGLQAFFFPMSFIRDLSVLERLTYVGFWIINGGLMNILTVTTIIAYLIVALAKYEEDKNFAKKSVTTTLLLYLVLVLKSAVISHKHFKSMLFFMLGDEINWLCDKNDSLCAGWGLKFWWDEAWNEQVCLEENNGDCKLDVADLSSDTFDF